MAEKKATEASLLSELFQPGLYKRSQGRIARQLTFAALALTAGIGAWRLADTLADTVPWVHFGVPGVLALVGVWLAFRVVNLPTFADFLISVEGEMAKVSWPSRGELVRSSIVVIVTIILLAAILFAYDLGWNYLLRIVGVIREE